MPEPSHRLLTQRHHPRLPAFAFPDHERPPAKIDVPDLEAAPRAKGPLDLEHLQPVLYLHVAAVRGFGGGTRRILSIPAPTATTGADPGGAKLGGAAPGP